MIKQKEKMTELSETSMEIMVSSTLAFCPQKYKKMFIHQILKIQTGIEMCSNKN